MGVGAAIGALVGMAAGAAGVVVAGFTAGTMWMAGAAVGSLFDEPPKTDFGVSSDSPTYTFGPIQNTKTQKIPVPLVYGKNRLAGNIIMQNFLDTKKTKQDLLIALGLGEFNSISDVKANELSLSSNPPEGCSLSIYRGTSSQTADPRSLGGKRYPNIAYLATTLKASEKLSGNPTITSIVEGRKVWTPSGVKFSRNPAWIIYDILTGTYWDPDTGRNEPVGLGLPLELVDLESFIEAANYCDELVDGEPRFTLDYVIDTQRSAIDQLTDILSCFRGALIARDKIALYIDKPVTAPYKAIGLDNIIEGSFTWWQRPEDDIYNRVVVEWVNPDMYWEQTVSVFENEADIAERGIVERRYQLYGITRAIQAQRMGAYLLDVSNGSINMCQFGLSIKDSDIEVGDVIAITHDLPGWENKWFRVIKLEDQDDDTIVVTASEYVAEAYNDRAMDITLTIDTNLESPFEIFSPENLVVSEWGYKTKSGDHIANLDLSWDPPPQESARVEYYSVYTIHNGIRRWAARVEPQSTGKIECTLGNVPIGEGLVVQVYAKSVYGDWSDPAEKTVNVIGIDVKPPAPEDVSAVQRGNYIVVDGVVPDMPDFKCLEVRIGGSSWTDANYVGRFDNFPFEFSGVLDGTRVVRVKTVDNAGQLSVEAASYVLNVIGVNETLNVIFERDDIDSRTGTLTNLHRRPDGILVSYDTIQYGDLADTYGDLGIATYQENDGDMHEVLSPVIDTYKVGRTSLRFDFVFNAIMAEASYGNILNRTYGLFPDDTYGSISVVVDQETKVKFSNDNIEWSDWERYISGEKTFRYTQYRYRLTPNGTPSHLTITQLKQIYDVPDIEIIDTVSVPAGGITLNFVTDYGKDFYYAPKEIIPIVLDNDGSVYPYISNVSSSGLKITCYNTSGTSVAHDVQLTIRGY
jgi:hypothetical protein